MSYESNAFIDRLPEHLKQFIIPQNYDEYTPVDQAVWRYVMRKNVAYLTKVAHHSYVDGLRKTGIGIEQIPSMYGMNRILKEIGWAAVAVDGFIPPNAFMEFQAYKVLVIATDIRLLENIEYTPAPDIIHESAGHAPIIANSDYAEYLRRLGAIGAKAILSQYDMDLYEAVRKLSILKEAEGIHPEEIQAAEIELSKIMQKDAPLSEMAMVRNLQWWTVEYGLIGTLDNYKIYGAGLLSSIGESKWCMRNEVKKIPYSIHAAYQDFDITKPQPQLFVTPDFYYLMEVLEEFADTLSLRKGGSEGIQNLIDSRMVGTIKFNTGIQISGQFTKMKLSDEGRILFFATEGPTALAFRDKELIGHGTEEHHDGLLCPLGPLKNTSRPIEEMKPSDFNTDSQQRLHFDFASGFTIEGRFVTNIRNVMGQLMLIRLKDCTVAYQGQNLHTPMDGIYDLVVGSEVISAYAGYADILSFPNLYNVSETRTIRPVKTRALTAVEKMYQEVRNMRAVEHPDEQRLMQIFDQVQKENKAHWLLGVEIYEISKQDKLRSNIHQWLLGIINQYPRLETVILEGIEMADEHIEHKLPDLV